MKFLDSSLCEYRATPRLVWDRERKRNNRSMRTGKKLQKHMERVCYEVQQRKEQVKWMDSSDQCWWHHPCIWSPKIQCIQFSEASLWRDTEDKNSEFRENTRKATKERLLDWYKKHGDEIIEVCKLQMILSPHGKYFQKGSITNTLSHKDVSSYYY